MRDVWDYVFAGKHFVFVGTFQNLFRLLRPLSIYIVQLFTLDQSCEFIYVVLLEISSELIATLSWIRFACFLLFHVIFCKDKNDLISMMPVCKL